MSGNSEAAYEPGEVLKWLIKETGGIGISNTNDSTSNDSNPDSKVDSLSAMSSNERVKWMNVILGKTDEQVSFRKRLENMIKELNQIVTFRREYFSKVENINLLNDDGSTNENSNDKNKKGVPSEASMNAFILKSLKMIRDLSDQNEMVLVKNNLLNTLFELILNENELLDIRLESISILNTIIQNNPVIQNAVYRLKNVSFLNRQSENGVGLMTRLLFKTQFDHHKQELNSKNYNYTKYYQFRTRIWIFILNSCHHHNPNLNVFLSEKGYQIISSQLQKVHKQS